MYKAKSILDKKERNVAIAIYSPMVVLSIQGLILELWNLHNTGLGSDIQLISKVVVMILFLMSMKEVLRRQIIFFVMTYIAAILIYCANWFLFPDNGTLLMDNFFALFFTCFPCFIYSYSIVDLKLFEKVFKYSSYAIFLIGMIRGISILNGAAIFEKYSMSFGYYMLMPNIYFLKKFLNKLNIFDGLMALFSTLIILSLGSRGPIMCIIAYVTMFTILNIQKRTKRSMIKTLVTLVGIGIFTINIDKLLLALAFFLEKYEIDSRSIRLFTMDKINLSGREDIFSTIYEKITNNPFGKGLFSDRFFAETYAHNIFLEMLIEWGIIVGSIIIILIVVLIIKGVFNKNKDYANLVIQWVAIGFVPLLVSSSYLTSFNFWILLGILVNKKLKIKSRKVEVHGE